MIIVVISARCKFFDLSMMTDVYLLTKAFLWMNSNSRKIS
jgi:hypothetical protein